MSGLLGLDVNSYILVLCIGIPILSFCISTVIGFLFQLIYFWFPMNHTFVHVSNLLDFDFVFIINVKMKWKRVYGLWFIPKDPIWFYPFNVGPMSKASTYMIKRYETLPSISCRETTPWLSTSWVPIANIHSNRLRLHCHHGIATFLRENLKQFSIWA
jgi:hypothetical protein